MLVILSLLGYGTSRQDLRSSSLSLEQTSAYYNACSEAADFYSDLVQTLEEFQEQAKTETAYYQLVSDHLNSQENVKWDSEEHTAEYMNAFSDTQSLAVKVSVFWTCLLYTSIIFYFFRHSRQDQSSVNPQYFSGYISCILTCQEYLSLIHI